MREIKILKSVTDRKEESLNRYLSDIGQIQMINPKEEVLLAKKIREGDKAAEDKLITANLRFVVSCAKKYRNHGMSLPDLVCEGNFGLIKAARLFDETRGFKFISYAVWWIRQAMIHALNEHKRVIRMPMNQQLGMQGYTSEADKLEQELERVPTLAEVAEASGKAESKLADFMFYNIRVGYLEDPLPGGVGEETSLLHYLPDSSEDVTAEWIKTDAIQAGVAAILKKLRKRDREIIILAFGLFGQQQLENEDIAVKLNLSTERIRQLKLQAIKDLQMLSEVKALKEYA